MYYVWLWCVQLISFWPVEWAWSMLNNILCTTLVRTINMFLIGWVGMINVRQCTLYDWCVRSICFWPVEWPHVSRTLSCDVLQFCVLAFQCYCKMMSRKTTTKTWCVQQDFFLCVNVLAVGRHVQSILLHCCFCCIGSLQYMHLCLTPLQHSGTHFQRT